MEKKTRRNFMKTLGASVGAAGVLGGGSLLSSCNRVEEVAGDKITLLTSSGELVVVDRSQLKPAEIPSLTENQLRGRKGLPGRSWVMVIDLSMFMFLYPDRHPERSWCMGPIPDHDCHRFRLFGQPPRKGNRYSKGSMSCQ